MSDEYKDPPWYYRQYESITVVPSELNEVGKVRQTKQRISEIRIIVDRLLKLP